MSETNWREDVAKLLKKHMEARDARPEAVEATIALWRSYLDTAAPRERSVNVYAASVEYAHVRQRGERITQSELARRYGTSASTISKLWREVASASPATKETTPQLAGAAGEAVTEAATTTESSSTGITRLFELMIARDEAPVGDGNPLLQRPDQVLDLVPAQAGQWSRAFAQQIFDEHEPGPLVREFDRLIDALREESVGISRAHGHLPTDILSALDEGSSRRLNPRAKRLQQTQFPHIDALMSLLHVSGLARHETRGKQRRLTLIPTVLARWETLDARARYATLMALWLDRYEPFESGWGALSTILTTLSLLERGQGPFLFDRDVRVHNALIDLAGIATFITGRKKVEGSPHWQVNKGAITDWGRHLMGWLGALCRANRIESPLEFGYASMGDALANALGVEPWSPLPPYPEFRDGVWRWKVSLEDVWRRIEIRGSASMYELALAVLDAFDFDDEDHLFVFALKDPAGRALSIYHPEWGEPFSATRVLVGHLPLDEGSEMPFKYDFGASWRFSLTLEAISTDRKLAKPWVVTAKKGRAPDQYDW